MTRTETLLAAYPDARVKFPGWFVVMCKDCHECWIRYSEVSSNSGLRAQANCYMQEHDAASKDYYCIAPDLTLKENLHLLLELADAVDDDGLSETDTSGGIVRHHILRNSKDYFGTGGNAGAPGARTLAAFNAIEKALGVTA